MMFLLGLSVAMALGCSEKPKPPAAAPPAPSGESAAPAAPVEAEAFPFTNKTETVTAEDVKTAEKSSPASAVTADFNGDGLPDRAVVEQVDKGQEQVSIYIQKPPEKEGEKPGKSIYYKGGTIGGVVEGKIVGVMTRERQGKTDLLLLVAHVGRPREVVQYRNDGAQFSPAEIHNKVWSSQTLQENLPLREKKAGPDK
jgi:hypothetical protein